MLRDEPGYLLLSGGVDSSTVLSIAAQRHKEVHALSVIYGQKHTKEVEYAKAVARYFGASHEVLDISSVIGRGGLSDPDSSVPGISYNQIEGVSPTYVPFRNGLLLSILASRAHGDVQGPVTIYYGAHAEDAQGGAYPDCTEDFVRAMGDAVRIGCYNEVVLHAPIISSLKHEIVSIGARNGVPWELTWSCYKGGEIHCGTCPTCRSRRRAFIEAGVTDPTEYAEEDDG